MRTIETIAAGCHLLTSNKDILNYKDISKSSYYIFERKDPKIFRLKPGKIKQLSNKYSLDAFIDQIFE